MEDTRDQNSDDLGADEYLPSSKARLEKYLQKQWQLGKRKLQVQVDFGNVPLEWEYLNQFGPRPGYWGQPQTPPGYWSPPLTQPDEGTSPGYGPGFTNAHVGGPWGMSQGYGGLPGTMPGMGMGMMSSGMGMTPPGMGMRPGMSLGAAPGMDMGLSMSMIPGMNMGMVQGLGMASGMGMMPQAFGFGDLGTLGLMDFLGGGEDFMEDMRDQNSDDLEADERLTSSKARLEKYLQKQWQLGKRKLQVQVEFGNVPLEWEYLNQYHGVRHPLAMTAFGP